jgi:hypothetical protein
MSEVVFLRVFGHIWLMSQRRIYLIIMRIGLRLFQTTKWS